MNKPLIEVCDIKKSFIVHSGFQKQKCVRAVDGVSFSIDKGETLGLVGESGCGKSSLGRTLLRLIQPDKGKIHFDGEDITHADMRPYRQRMQIVFQNPMSAVDPKLCVRDIIAEGLEINRIGGSKQERTERVLELLAGVGLNIEQAWKRPYELSGGQLQRVGIARALAVEPEFIVCDEAVSSLDVSCQSQIINLLEDMRQDRGLTYLFISHDLSIVRHLSDRIGVMYLGRFAELGSSETIVFHAAHPYTKSLLSAVPIPDPERSRQRVRSPFITDLSGEAMLGCRYSPRCKYAKPVCFEIEPEIQEIASGHFCACHLYG